VVRTVKLNVVVVMELIQIFVIITSELKNICEFFLNTDTR